MNSDVSLGLAHEAELRLRNAGATGENFWDPISKSEPLAKKVVAFVMEASRMIFVLAPDPTRDMTGWTCVEPVKVAPGEFEVVIEDFLEEGEPYIGGEEMVSRAKNRGIRTGLRHAEAMLREQEKIPVDQRKYVLIFPEVWQDPRGYRGVFYLFWSGERWNLDFRWLGDNFLFSFRLVSSRKYQKKP